MHRDVTLERAGIEPVRGQRVVQLSEWLTLKPQHESNSRQMPWLERSSLATSMRQTWPLHSTILRPEHPYA